MGVLWVGSSARLGFRGCALLAAGWLACACAGELPSGEEEEAPATLGQAQSSRGDGLWLPAVLSDRLVLQQGRPIAFWGRARAATRVDVALQRASDGGVVRSGSANAAADGSWKVVLDPLAASFTTYSARIQNEGASVTLEDVLVGEVWLSGGQSNMELPLRYTLEKDSLLAEARYPFLRIFYQEKVSQALARNTSPVPLQDVSQGAWKRAEGAAAVSDCSGIAYSFARALFLYFQKQGQEVPVGVLNTAVGGTPILTWMSREKIQSVPELARHLPGSWATSPSATVAASYKQPTACYNHKVAPLRHLALKGFLWSQGENDAGAGMGPFYRQALQALIEDWRGRWGFQDMPFVLAQLHPSARTCDDPGALDNVAFLREAQLETAQAVPQVIAQAIHDVDLAWDWGNFGNLHPVHPLSKQPVGERLAWAALALGYAKPGEYTGPLYERADIENGRATLWFGHVGDGLVLRGAEPDLRGFALAGRDRVFVPARARITGSRSVEVVSPGVPEPVAVSYAFTLMNQQANLMNSLGFPASPFRTDKERSQLVRVRPKLFYEAEMQAVAAISAGDNARVGSDGAASRGMIEVLEANAPGDFLAYGLTVPFEARFRLVVRAKRGKTLGQFQTWLNGAPLGSVQDLYAETGRFDWLHIVSEVALPKGRSELKFVVTGKNARSSDHDLVFDFIELAPLCPSHPSLFEDF